VFGFAIFVALALTRFVGRGESRRVIFIFALPAAISAAWVLAEQKLLQEPLLWWLLRTIMGTPQKVKKEGHRLCLVGLFVPSLKLYLSSRG
jgi:hypothetical protein